MSLLHFLFIKMEEGEKRLKGNKMNLISIRSVPYTNEYL